MPKVQILFPVLIHNDFLVNCHTVAVLISLIENSLQLVVWLDSPFRPSLLIHHAHYDFATFHENHA